VGEIKGKEGLSTIEEALFLIKGLNAHEIFPDWIALNNGTTHGIEEKDSGIQVQLTADIHKALERYSPEYAETVTGIPNHEIRAAARLYAMASRATIVYGTGITQYANGTKGVKAISNLALLTGNIGRSGGGIYALQRENNGQGACDMGGLPNVYSGYQAVTDGQIAEKFGKAWKANVSTKMGLTLTEMLKGAQSKEVKAMFILGENPMVSDADIHHVEECLKSLDFLVVQDIFMSETARLAEVVLPGAEPVAVKK
jgi:predicted molibdopterin-dependent oxidoreductase YjgC